MNFWHQFTPSQETSKNIIEVTRIKRVSYLARVFFYYFFESVTRTRLPLGRPLEKKSSQVFSWYGVKRGDISWACHFSRSYCCYGNPLCHKIDRNLLSNDGANFWYHAWLLRRPIYSGYIDPSKSMSWKVLKTGLSHLKWKLQ